MEYLKIEWRHNNKYDPYLIYCEIDSFREELRKVEIFYDGTLGYADKNNETANTRLSLYPIPSNEEINVQKEFVLKSISQEEFEDFWNKATEIDNKYGNEFNPSID